MARTIYNGEKTYVLLRSRSVLDIIDDELGYEMGDYIREMLEERYQAGLNAMEESPWKENVNVTE